MLQSIQSGLRDAFGPDQLPATDRTTPTTTTAPPRPGSTGTTPTDGAPAGGAASGKGVVCPDQQAVLDQHNKERAGAGAPPLKWSDSLAAEAAAWAGGCPPGPGGTFAVRRLADLGGWHSMHCFNFACLLKRQLQSLSRWVLVPRIDLPACLPFRRILCP